MNAPIRILVVDDEPPIRKLLRTCFATQGYDMIEADTGPAALAALSRSHVDLVVLDLGLPALDGKDVIREIRGKGLTIPIVVISARTDEAGKVRALDLGADDYVTKPFGVDELLARIRTALRHRLQQDGQRPIFRSGGLVVDVVRRLVTVDDVDVKLTPREFDILRVLVAHAGKVLTHKFLLDEVWGGQTDVQYLRIYVRSLRQKLEAEPARPRYILTEQGVGYRLAEPTG